MILYTPWHFSNSQRSIRSIQYTLEREDQVDAFGPAQLSPRRPEPAHDIIQELQLKPTPLLPPPSILPTSITKTHPNCKYPNRQDVPLRKSAYMKLHTHQFTPPP